MSEPTIEAQTTETDTAEAGGRSFPIAKIALGVLALALLVWLGRTAGDQVEPFRLWVRELGPAGPLVFALVYAGSVVLLAPASLLTIAGGAAFGLVQGTVVVTLGAFAGMTSAFLIARYLARDAVAKRIAKSPRFAVIDRAVGDEGFKIAFLLRLTPVAPFVFLNYALGLTSISVRSYLLSSLGIVPGTFLYVYIGSLTTDVAAAAASGGETDTAKLVINVVAFLATVVVTVVVTRIARRALAESANELQAEEA